MSSLTFSLSVAESLYNSTEQFPVDFDDLWQWCGYSRKDNALVVLQREMLESIDFSTSLKSQGIFGTKPTTKYYLTIDATKMFAMMAKTEKGREVRKYFIQCEKIAKNTLSQPVKQLPSAVEYIEAVAKLQSLSLPHTLKQLLLDKVGDELCTTQKSIAPAAAPVKMGVAQRAEELGFKIDSSNRIKLGKFMAVQDLPSFKEKRLCNGTFRAINVYEVNEALDELIRIYFNQAQAA